jgi:hypothetical protein
MHRYADRSAGLHLFQELSTLGQQLAHPLLRCHGLCGVKPMFPATAPKLTTLIDRGVYIASTQCAATNLGRAHPPMRP